MASCSFRAFQVMSCSVQRPLISKLDRLKNSSFSAFKEGSMKIHTIKESIKMTSVEIIDALTHMVFEFVDEPLLPSQSNFAPVEELGEAVVVDDIQGVIPDGFPQGVYIRNGPNPLFGGLKSTRSVFGRSSHIWVEGEGMLHALYFERTNDGRGWTLTYNNRHVETETFNFEKERTKPSFLPAMEGDSPAILSACLFNLMRFGKPYKVLSNTNVFEHSGKIYSVTENYLPQEINIHTLETLENWDINGAWNRQFTAHPKKAPGSGELVIMGVNEVKPFFQLGIVSADGCRLIHKADLEFERCVLCHDIGVTQRYNVILDFPLTVDINRLVNGGPLIKYVKDEYARIGVMPRYGDASSIAWFEVGTCSVFHIINSFEDGDEVVVWGCRANNSIIPGPDLGLNKFEWFSRGFKHPGAIDPDESFFSRAYEWRLNMITGEVKERYLTGTTFSMDFPMINDSFIGLKCKYGYTQFIDLDASSTSGMAKYGGLAKLHFDEPETMGSSIRGHGQGDSIKTEYHEFPEHTFCTGAAFVAKTGSLEEDDGWIVTFVHNEQTDVSQFYVVDANNFTSEPVAKITLPSRVPYGFHGAFMPLSSQLQDY